MHTVQSGYSLTLEIRDGFEKKLDEWLLSIRDDPGGNDKIPFNRIRSALYCSIVTVSRQSKAPDQSVDAPPTPPSEKELPAMMMFLSSISGPMKTHIDQLVQEAGAGMRELLGFCKGVDEVEIASDKGLKRYLLKKKATDTFYTGMQYLSYDDIEKENILRQRLEVFINEEQKKGNQAFLSADNSNWASKARKEIIDFTSSQQDLEWATKPWKLSLSDYWQSNIALWRTLLFILGVGILTLIGAHFGVPYLEHLWSYFWKGIGIFVSVFLLLLILNDFKKHSVAGRLKDSRVKDINAHQLHPVINEITLAGPVKKGFIRRLAFFLILWLAKNLKFALKIPTVVTARWIPMNGSKRLVFISNFANTSEGYVRDFIDSKGRGRKINLIFGQGYGYPRTLFVVFKGAIDNPIPFVNDVYWFQHNTQFWYSPFKDLTIDNIRTNHEIRKGLAGNMSEKNARKWLKSF